MAASYLIDVLRKENDGILTFTGGGVNVSTTCWWDPNMVINAGKYAAYATRMSNKDDGVNGAKREGIWLGRGVKYNKGANSGNGAFIHKGTGPSWSDGCIIVVESELLAIWNAIQPKETANIEVTIRDEVVKVPDVPQYGAGQCWGIGMSYAL
ncbi:hypothetical protein IV417_07795 [Alphaproteobacteria bacterium KMM 3653]|uniref:YkuD domain-containing protein n=1 Tax=Harenicola maris TaxID=2841044 RepID=A0AAP2G3X4_9RHOB|nr:hypothetical protein [Harenicola maris]